MVRRCLIWPFLMGFCLMGSWTTVVGSEHAMTFGDIVITEKKPFPEGGNGQGYYMLTLDIRNLGNEPHRVQVKTQHGRDRPLPYHSYGFSNEIFVEPGRVAKLDFPMIWCGENEGSLEIRIDNRPQKDLFELSFVPTGSYYREPDQTFFLVSPDMSASFIGTNENGASFGAVRSALRQFGPGEGGESQFLLLDPSAWPQAWLTLSPFDGLAFSKREWQRFDGSQRQAILDYLSLGGMVIFEGAADELPVTSLEANDTEGMSIHSVGFGLLLERVGSLSELNKNQWEALIPEAIQSSSIWDRNLYVRNSATLKNHLDYVDRGDTEVSVRTLSLLLLVFACVIGPLNLWFLTRIRRRVWLWWTIPALALVTSGLVFLWLTILEGRTPHEVQETISVLDQAHHRVHSIGRYGVYSPQRIGKEGLQFSRGSEIAPAYTERDDVLNVDFREGARFESDWVPARIPAIFLLRKSDMRRERLAVDFEGEQARIVNGLGVPLEWLIIRGPKGDFFEVRDIAAGAEAFAPKIETPTPKAQKMRQAMTDLWLFKATIDQDDLPWPNPNQYLARTAETPFGERPVSGKTTKKERALIYGILGDQP